MRYGTIRKKRYRAIFAATKHLALRLQLADLMIQEAERATPEPLPADPEKSAARSFLDQTAL